MNPSPRSTGTTPIWPMCLVFALAACLLPGCAATPEEPPVPPPESQLSTPARFLLALDAVNMDTDTAAHMRKRFEQALRGTGWSIFLLSKGGVYQTKYGPRSEVEIGVKSGDSCVINLDLTALLGFPKSVNLKPYGYIVFSTPEKVKDFLQRGGKVIALSYPLKNDSRYLMHLKSNDATGCFNYVHVSHRPPTQE